MIYAYLILVPVQFRYMYVRQLLIDQNAVILIVRYESWFGS